MKKIIVVMLMIIGLSLASCQNDISEAVEYDAEAFIENVYIGMSEAELIGISDPVYTTTVIEHIDGDITAYSFNYYESDKVIYYIEVRGGIVISIRTVNY